MKAKVFYPLPYIFPLCLQKYAISLKTPNIFVNIFSKILQTPLFLPFQGYFHYAGNNKKRENGNLFNVSSKKYSFLIFHKVELRKLPRIKRKFSENTFLFVRIYDNLRLIHE